MTGPAHQRPTRRQLGRRYLARVDLTSWLLLANLVLTVAVLAVVLRIAAIVGAL